jgi:biofilm protein TabA
MRWITDLEAPLEGIVRLMLYETGNGVFLFLYDRKEDAPCAFDEWFEDCDAAREEARLRFGVQPERWVWIPDPRVGDRDDLIAPRRAAAEGCGG